jgi:hypothetical protein
MGMWTHPLVLNKCCLRVKLSVAVPAEHHIFFFLLLAPLHDTHTMRCETRHRKRRGELVARAHTHPPTPRLHGRLFQRNICDTCARARVGVDDGGCAT